MIKHSNQPLRPSCQLDFFHHLQVAFVLRLVRGKAILPVLSIELHTRNVVPEARIGEGLLSGVPARYPTTVRQSRW